MVILQKNNHMKFCSFGEIHRFLLKSKNDSITMKNGIDFVKVSLLFGHNIEDKLHFKPNR